MVRGKHPEADLRRKYPKVFRLCTGISLALHVLVAVFFQEFEVEAAKQKKDQIIINMEDIPETRQIQRPPPPPRPAVPIETESEEVPDDVTIESTDLDFDKAFVDVPPPPPPGSEERCRRRSSSSSWSSRSRSW
jgi:protein TonB